MMAYWLLLASFVLGLDPAAGGGNPPLTRGGRDYGEKEARRAVRQSSARVDWLNGAIHER